MRELSPISCNPHGLGLAEGSKFQSRPSGFNDRAPHAVQGSMPMPRSLQHGDPGLPALLARSTPRTARLPQPRPAHCGIAYPKLRLELWPQEALSTRKEGCGFISDQLPPSRDCRHCGRATHVYDSC